MTISPAQFPAVTVTVVRDRKIRTALRTNQIVGFVTVPSWKKIIAVIYLALKDIKLLSVVKTRTDKHKLGMKNTNNSFKPT